MDLVNAIGQKSERLLEKALKNNDITCAFRWFVEQLGFEIEKAKADLANVTISSIQVSEDKLITKVSYSSVQLVRHLPDYPDASDFVTLVGKENQYLYRCIKLNPGFLDWLHNLVQIVEAHCKHKGKKYEDFEFATYDRFLTNDGRTFVLTIS